MLIFSLNFTLKDKFGRSQILFCNQSCCYIFALCTVFDDEQFVGIKTSVLHNSDRGLCTLVTAVAENVYRLGSFSEFGLRRRLSSEAQELAVKTLAEADYNGNSLFVGTSNVYLAKKYNLTPVGTMAHEWIMCTGQGNHKHNPAYSNWYALDAWVREYGILNGIALTDAITTDCFLKDFSLLMQHFLKV